MRSRVFPLATVAAIAVLILAPAIIWGGRRASDNATREAAVKVPEVSTIGPEMVPYVPTPAEREKLNWPACGSAVPLEHLYDRGARTIVKSEGPYPGMTPAELEKLAAWQARVREFGGTGASTMTRPPREPVSTIEMIPREPGIEGLTPAEKAKLEAYLKEGGRR
jgi:hypothetical protein